jgi:uncharacterized protein (DUF58 family)
LNPKLLTFKAFVSKNISPVRLFVNRSFAALRNRKSLFINRVIYFIVLLSSFLYVYLNGGYIPYLLIELVIILPLLSLGYTLLSLLFLKVTQEIEKTQVIKNETVKFQFELKSRNILYIPFVRIHFNFENIAFDQCNETLNISVFPLSDNINTHRVRCKLTGIFQAGIRNLEIIDMLGLFKFTKKVQQIDELAVLPRFLSIDELNASQSAGFNKAASRKALYVDPQSIDDIRKYALGDSYRSIHWKLSAKKNELLVKRHEKTSDNLALVIVDLQNPKTSRDAALILRDQVLEYTVSVLYYCLSNEFIVTFIYFGPDGKVEISAKDLNDFSLIYTNILRLDLIGDIRLSDIVLKLVDEIPFKHNMITISHQVDREFEAAMSKAHDKGYRVFVYDSSKPILSADHMNTQEIIASIIV